VYTQNSEFCPLKDIPGESGPPYITPISSCTIPTVLDTVVINGPRIGAQPTLTISPASVNFGSVTVGKTSAPRTITITNKSTATGSLQSFQDVIPPQSASANFAVATNSCVSALPLAPGGSCKFTVTFTPSKTGAVTASVMLLDNAPDTPQLVTLTGTGQ